MDKITAERRSENMRRIRGKNTNPELIVRHIIYHMGYRYRLGGCNLPGRPDLVFKNRHKVIFVHGCFWHQHDKLDCKEKHIPKSNLDYWLPKLDKNKRRFADTVQKLQKMGWEQMVIWECQLKELEKITNDIQSYLE